MRRKQIKDLDMSMAQIRASMFAPTTPVTTPDGGVYVFDPADNSSADNTGLVLVTAGGQRLKRQVPDRRITPQMFGAVGDGVADDTAALQAWLNAAGVWHLFLPAGTYKCGTLTRTNKGALMLTGAGSSRTRILSSGNGDGLAISNPAGGNLGLLRIDGVRITCAASKQAGARGLYLAAQHEAQPGVLLADVVIDSDGTNEWPVHYQAHDCSYTSYDRVFIKGINLNTGTVGVKVTNSFSGSNPVVGRPAVNHSLGGINIQAVQDGVIVDCHGSPGIEGVNLSGCRIVSATNGYTVTSADYSATWVSISDCHAEIFGGYCLKVSGYSQVLFAGTNDWYKHGTATQAIWLDNLIGVSGDMGHIVTFDHTDFALDITGPGGNYGLLLFRHTGDDQSSGDVRIAAGVIGSRIHYHWAWSGIKGVSNPQRWLDLSNTSELTGTPEAAQTVATISNGFLDLRGVYGKLVTLNAGQTGPITSVGMRYGQQCVLRFNTPLTVNSNGGIWLAGRANRTFRPTETLTLYRSVENVEEVGRGLLADSQVRVESNITLGMEHNGKTLLVVGSRTINVPTGSASLPVDFEVKIWNNDNGLTTLASGNGNWFNAAKRDWQIKNDSSTGVFGRAVLRCLDNNWWGLSGSVLQ